MNSKTLDYYNTNAAAFAQDTQGAAFTDMQDRFLKLLPAGPTSSISAAVPA